MVHINMDTEENDIFGGIESKTEKALETTEAKKTSETPTVKEDKPQPFYTADETGVKTVKLATWREPSLIADDSGNDLIDRRMFGPVDGSEKGDALIKAIKDAEKKGSLIDWLKANNLDDTRQIRLELAKRFGVGMYEGTAEKNTELMNKIKAGLKNYVSYADKDRYDYQ